MMTPLRRLCRRLGYDLVPLRKSRDDHDRLVQILGDQDIDMVVDVGANVGQYGQALRTHGYRGMIVSIEPIPAAHARLRERAAADANWSVLEPMAAGSKNGTAQLDVSNESDMSSLLPQSELLQKISPSSEITQQLAVKVARLDGLEPLKSSTASRIMLKMDVQGYEPEVLSGAQGILDRITVLQLEMALLPVYEGERDYRWMIDHLTSLGYELRLVIPGYFERKLARQLQFDGVFVRRSGDLREVDPGASHG